MLTPEIMAYFKTTALEKVERLTVLSSLLGNLHPLTEEDYSELKVELDAIIKLYGVFNNVLGRYEALMELLPDHLYYGTGLTPEVVGFLRGKTAKAAERLLVLGLMLELAGTPRNLTIEDYSRLREEIEMLKDLIISSLQPELLKPKQNINLIAMREVG
jgi:hypothetical protein